MNFWRKGTKNNGEPFVCTINIAATAIADISVHRASTCVQRE